MQPTSLLASIVLLAAAVSTPLLAGDRDRDHERNRKHATDTRAANGFDHGMQAIPNSATPDAPGYGWRYFSDPTAHRAVVISPQGDYYYSHGKGLRRVVAAST
jgi:hypothetical protein